MHFTLSCFLFSCGFCSAGVVFYVDVRYLNHVQDVGTMPVYAAPGRLWCGFPVLLVAGGYWLVRRFVAKSLVSQIETREVAGSLAANDFVHHHQTRL